MTKKKTEKTVAIQKKLPKATHEGVIFGGVQCYVLSDGRRLVTQRTMVGALSGGAEDGKIERYIERLPNGSALLASGPNVEFSMPKGGVAHGIEASTIAKMLKLYADALGSGKLRANQLPVAYRAVTLLSQFAEIGLIALIDEATGYQKIRPDDDLNSKLIRMIREEMDDIDPVYKSLLIRIAKLPGSTRCVYNGTGTPPAWSPLVANKVVTCVWGEEGRKKLRALNPNPTWTHRDPQHLDNDGKKLINRAIGVAEALASTARSWDDWIAKMDAWFQNKPLQEWLW